MSSPPESNVNAEALVKSLRRKENNWIFWGQACQQLQKTGYSPQRLFEETGFEPIHQNQVIVGSQVYKTLEKAEIQGEVLKHFEHKGSDILYELRVLNQQDRAKAATFICEKGLDFEASQELVKSFKDFSLLQNPPEGFSSAPGDIIAYRCWKLARQKSDLQARSRLIARGLQFAQSDKARQNLQQLLTDFTVVKEQAAPTLPTYRLESETELPRIVPYLGQLPLSPTVLDELTPVPETGAFRVIQSPAQQSWVALPGWKIVFQAQHPITFSCSAENLPNIASDTQRQDFLVLVDCAQQTWDINSYFLIVSDGEMAIRWFDTAPQTALLGKVLVVIRPKKVLDEDYNKELWMIDE